MNTLVISRKETVHSNFHVKLSDADYQNFLQLSSEVQHEQMDKWVCDMESDSAEHEQVQNITDSGITGFTVSVGVK